MADLVTLPAQGSGDTSPKVSTQQVTADSSQVQDVALATVVGGVRTRIGVSAAPVRIDPTGTTTQPVSAASLPLPSGASTEATLGGVLTTSDFDSKAGSLTETAPATDTASSGLNGRLQRLAQRITSLIGLLPSALVGGRLDVNLGAAPATVTVAGTVTANAGTGNLATSVADGANVTIGTTTDAETTGNGSLVAILKKIRTYLAGTLTVSGTISTKTAITASAPATATVGTSSAQALAANANRKGLILTNTSTNTMYLGIGATAVIGSGIYLQPNGGSWSMDDYSFVTGAINAIAGGASSNLSIQEFTT